MRDNDQNGPPVPYLVLRQDAQERCRLGLTLVPMVEVPSGTLGPWITPSESLDAALADEAERCLQQAMACDAVCSVALGPHRSTVAPAADWRLANTKLMTPDGEALYFSPATVCWCDDTGEPRYDCDGDLYPAGDMLDARAAAPAGFVAVADERVEPGALRPESEVAAE